MEMKDLLVGLQDSKTRLTVRMDMKEFVARQKVIYDKYIDNLSKSSHIDLIDKYILQIIEEVEEARAETGKGREDFLHEELIDIAMYCGSTLFAIHYKYVVNDNVIFSIAKNDIIDINNLLESITNRIIKERRNFPERKWHKKYDSSLINNDRIGSFTDCLMLIIFDIFSYLLSECTYEEINIILNKKQRFITEL